MFGNKRSKNAIEQSKGILSSFLDKREEFEANISTFEVAEKQMALDMAQVQENIQSHVDNATLSVETESVLLHSMEEFSKEQTQAFSDYMLMCEGIKQLMEDAMELVDKNKHFTTPAKQLGEMPQTLRERNKHYEEKLTQMAEEGKQLVILADESSEDKICKIAKQYEADALALRDEIRDSYKELKELENVIHHMVSLLKESNIAATQLLKKCQSNTKAMEKSAVRNWEEDVADFKDKIISIRNLDEDMLKSGERSKLLMSDIREELQTIQTGVAEMESEITYLMDVAEEQVK